MPRRNYFEILGLDFDPPEKNLRKIQKAIAAWKAETEKVLNTEQIATRKAALEAELSLADDMAAVMQNNKTRNDEARELKNQRVAQLESLLDILLAGKRGQPVYAAGAGKVVYVGNQLRGYGNLIMIKHGEDYITAYAHNDTMLVNNGQNVKAGQKIATMGSTGTDTVKLHFQIRYKATAIDPQRYLPAQGSKPKC